MFSRRILKITAALLCIYIALWIPAIFWPSYLDSLFGLIAAIPYLSIYIFHSIGIPGLLQNNGACGWGWCAPTLGGWIFLVIFWALATWLLAYLIASLTHPSSGTR